MGYVYGPKQTAIMTDVVERPIQKILHYNQYNPINDVVADLEQPEPVCKTQDEKGTPINGQVHQKGQRGKVDVGTE